MRLPVLLCLLILLASCRDSEPAPPPPPVDRLIEQIEDAEIQSVLDNPAALPPAAPGGALLDERFDDLTLRAWQEVDLERKSLGPVGPQSCRRAGRAVVFEPRKNRFLFRRFPIPPGVVLSFEAVVRTPAGTDPATPPVFLNEYRGDQIFRSFSTLVRAKKLASLAPTPQSDDPDEDGFITYRLVWRTGSRSHVLTTAIAPALAPDASEELEVRTLRVSLAPPADLLSWYDGADPPVDQERGPRNGRYLVRAELDRHRADGLFAPPESRFRFPSTPRPEPCRLLVGCAVMVAQGTGGEGTILFRATAETPEGLRPLAEVAIEVPRSRAQTEARPVLRREIDVEVPARTTALVLETARADPEPLGLVPAYLLDPVLVAAAAPADRPPNLLLISLDTLRADHLSAYGYSRPTSPFLEQFARRGALFEEAMSQAAFTLPSHVTMLSGQYPSVHRVEEVWDHIQPQRSPMLAPILRRHGYRTAAYTGGILVHSSYGFEHGFDRYSNLDPLIFDDGRAVLDWIDASRASPFFLFVHTYNIHDFITTPDLVKMFHQPGRSRLEGLIYPMWGVVDVREGATDEDRRYVTDLYDASVANADRFVRRIVEHLEKAGLADNTIIVVTSDHGKELLDRGVLAHGHTLHQELVHVPLIIRVPGLPPARVAQAVGIVDLAPTLLDLLGMPLPEAIQGRSVVSLLRGGSLPSRPLLAEQIHTPFHLYALRDRAEKLLRIDLIEGSDRHGTKPRSFFNLDQDPGERNDLYDSSERASVLDHELDDLLARLHSIRLALDERSEANASRDLRDDVLDALKQAGYVK